MATIKTRTAAEIESIIDGVDAGHRMASCEPDDHTRENGRRILQDEISADEAVLEAIAKYRAHSRR